MDIDINCGWKIDNSNKKKYMKEKKPKQPSWADFFRPNGKIQIS
jgi:hypothetical protein